MKSLIAISLLALTTTSHADRLITAPAVPTQVIITGALQLTPFEAAQPASVSIAEGDVVHARLAPDGTLEFGPGATVDFADVKPFAGNPVPMYVVVRVQGKKYLMPLYEYVE